MRLFQNKNIANMNNNLAVETNFTLGPNIQVNRENSSVSNDRVNTI